MFSLRYLNFSKLASPKTSELRRCIMGKCTGPEVSTLEEINLWVNTASSNIQTICRIFSDKPSFALFWFMEVRAVMLGACQATLSDMHGCAHKTGKKPHIGVYCGLGWFKNDTRHMHSLPSFSCSFSCILPTTKTRHFLHWEDCALLTVVSFAGKLCPRTAAQPCVKEGVCSF